MPDLVADRLSAEFDAVMAEQLDLDATAIIERTRAHKAEALVLTSDVRLGADEIQALPLSLKIAATCSVGFDHLDVAAARERRIVLTNTPDVVTECTADLTFLLILGACRRATEYSAIMQQGWRRAFAWNDMLGSRVAGKTLGIVGMGRIGRAVAKRARGFGMKVIYAGRTRLPSNVECGAQFFPTLQDMLPHAEILTLHLPGGSQTDKIMNTDTFALLPKGAVFVNTARGRLVDEDALLEALTSGHLYAAGLDVFAKEPDFDLRLAKLPNVFLMPHVGTSTRETRNAMGFRALDNIAAVCAGRPPIDPLW